MCVVNGTLEVESSVTDTVASYHWDVINCTNSSRDPCFYSQDQTSQNITGSDLLAQDAGTVRCIATINGSKYSSNPLTFRISGELCIYVRFILRLSLTSNIIAFAYNYVCY